MSKPNNPETYIFKRLSEFLASDEPNAQGWYDAHCPLHDDKTRSAGFNFDQGIWSCRKTCGSGRLDDLVGRLDARDEFDFGTSEEAIEDDEVIDTSNMTGAQVIGLSAKKRRQRRPMPTDDLIKLWQARLRADSTHLKAFMERRGFTIETLDNFEIGWSDEDNAYTLPIRSANGALLNVRLYRINAQETKIWSYGSPGMDASAIFPESALTDNHMIVIAEGEWDAIMLHQQGIAAVSGTTGAEQWMEKWNRKFKGKDVYFVYDRDKSGDAGADRAARMLTGHARSIYLAELPLPWTEKKGQDVSDFFQQGRTKSDFQAVLANAKVYAAPKDGAPIEVSVRESYNPLLSGKPMAMSVTVVGKYSDQHLIPREAICTCRMNANKTCSGCPMFDAEGKIEVEIERHDAVILKLRDVSELVRNDNIRLLIGAHKCGKMDVSIKSNQAQEQLTCRTSLDYSVDEEGDTTQRVVINVGEYGTSANQVVRLIGTTYPDPKTQSSVFQAWASQPVESSLDQYEADEKELTALEMFRPTRNQTPLQKMQEIALDLSDNVTRIVGRPELHMAMDIVWHSAIGFDFAGEPIERGWCELLVVGDARTGKSEIAAKLARHYGLGRVISCESASLPGLLGAVKPHGGKGGWVLEWGAIPLNDRKLIVMDEAAGLTHEQIGQLSSVRSSGRAEIIKVETHQTHARTRLIWLSNPRDNRVGMGAYMYGVRAIQPLIGNQEDIARFDFAMSVASDDVPLDVINRRNTNRRDHVYTATACHSLVRWAWSRKREEIEFTIDAEDVVYASSKEMGREYVADPPLVQGQNIRTKIARMAVAIAARTFSTDRTHTKIIVKPVHVEAAVAFLNHIYGLEGFGYREASARAKADERMAIANMDDVREYLYSRPGLARYLVAAGGEFSTRGMREVLNLPQDESNLIIQKLSGMSMIKASGDWNYRITPHLNTVLRETKE